MTGGEPTTRGRAGGAGPGVAPDVPTPSAEPVLDLGGEPVQLLAERAAWLPRQRLLLVADVHFGKAMAFRRLGVPVPGGTTSDTLQRLGALADRLHAAGVVFLGDFLHAPGSRATATLDTLQRWRDARPGLRLRLVRGNHDVRAGDPPPSLGVEVVDEPWPVAPGLVLGHHPRPGAGVHLIAGHLHPCVHLGRGPDRLRLPCFRVGADVTVLPAFGAFTGMHPVALDGPWRLFAVADDRVVAVPVPSLRP